MKNIITSAVALVAFLPIALILSPIFLLSKLGNKWAINFLNEGAEPMDIYGTINDVLITSDILTSGEVSTLYNSGAGIAYSGGGGGGSPAQNQNIIIFE